MEERPVLISVIVCTFNRAALLRGCLESLVAQSLDRSLYEILVVDNDSSDETHELTEHFIKRHGNIRYLKEASRGLSHARNKGWREGNGAYIAYIDDDARAAHDWCEKILNAFRTVEPEPVAVGGEIHPFYEKTPPAWFSDEFEIRSWGSRPGFLKPPYVQYGFSGSNMAFQRSALAAVNGFSSEFGMIGNRIRLGEDAELFSRLYKTTSLFWYDPSITVLHRVSGQNMTIAYRLKRYFSAGQQRARMADARLSLYHRVGNIVGLLLSVIKLPFILIVSGTSVRKVLVKRIQEYANRLGYIIGDTGSRAADR